MTRTVTARAERLGSKVARIAALAVMAGAVMAVAPAMAAAESIWVSHAPTVSGNGKSCTTPGSNTIQGAIGKASSGEKIHVCAGTYEEQLKISQAVSLVAAGSATVKLPSPVSDSTSSCGEALSATTQVVVDICGAGTVKITGINVEGDWAAGTCNDNLYDILASNGTNLELSDSSVLGAGASPINGCQGGTAVQIGGPTESATATLSNDTVEGYQKNGIDVFGASSSATIKSVTIHGAGLTNVIAQNGIQLSYGAVAKIVRTAVDDDEYEGAYSAGGMLVFEAKAGTTVKHSSFNDDDIGLYYGESGTTPLAVSASEFVGDVYDGLFVEEGALVSKKDVFNGGEDGIGLYQQSAEHSGPQGSATDDKIENMSSYAVAGFWDGKAGDPAGAFTVKRSQISNNPPGADVEDSVFSESPTLVITEEHDT